MIQEKLPFVDPGEEWTKRGGPGKRREGRRLRGMYSYFVLSMLSMGWEGRLKKRVQSKANQGFCLISLLGLWKEAAHTSLGYSPMMRTWLPSMAG